jgi:hypothetical protein
LCLTKFQALCIIFVAFTGVCPVASHDLKNPHTPNLQFTEI